MATEVEIGDVLERPRAAPRLAVVRAAKPIPPPAPATSARYPGWLVALTVIAIAVVIYGLAGVFLGHHLSVAS